MISDYQELERRRKQGKPLGNYRLPSGFGNGEYKTCDICHTTYQEGYLCDCYGGGRDRRAEV